LQQKNTPFEGGVRVPALIWSPLFKDQQRVSNQWIHNSDWLPTLAEAAKIRIKGIDLDGVSQWSSLVNNSPGPRREILNNIDDYTGYSSYMNGGWKLVNETLMPGIFDNVTVSAMSKSNGWIGEIDNDFNMTDETYVNTVLNSLAGKILAETYPSSKLPTKNFLSFPFWNKGDKKSVMLALREEATVQCYRSKPKIPCNPMISPCLFNVVKDPCEYINLAAVLPFKVQKMKWNLERHRQRMVPTRRQPSDPACDPINFDLEWSWWRDDANSQSSRSVSFDNLYALNLIEDIKDDPIEDNARFLNKTVTLKSLIITGGVVVLALITFKMVMSFKSSKVKPFEDAK
jgi:arylsulfatase B